MQEELAPECQFNYKESKPNRFADARSGGAIGVVLEPDVAAAFKTSKKVNAFLRSLISRAPQSKRRPAR